MRWKTVLAALAIVLSPVAATAQAPGPIPTPNQTPTAAEIAKPVEENLLGETRDPAEIRAVQSDAKAGTEEGSAAQTISSPTRTKADPLIGQPIPGATGLQATVTGIGEDGRWMNDVLLEPLMAAVCLVVFGLLLYVMVSYRRRDGKEPSRISHNTLVEVIWTVVPVLILVAIAVPSFQLLANQYDPPKPDLTVKAIGHQWYWEYQYPDNGDFGFDSVMLSDDKADAEGSPRSLEVDNRLVVPAGATVKVLVTAVDVGHAWAVPAFWVKMDAWPGRVNETWFKTDRPGVYYGQCSELCGVNHAYMPIVVEVLPRPQFDAWLRAKQAENGIAPGTSGTADKGTGPVNTVSVSAPAAGSTETPASPGMSASTPPSGEAGTGQPSDVVTPAAPVAENSSGSNNARGGTGTNTDN